MESRTAKRRQNLELSSASPCQRPFSDRLNYLDILRQMAGL
jgi:hypothetical protein